MKFFEILIKKKIIFLNIFLFLYIITNLFTGDRGLISYFDKKELNKYLENKKVFLSNEIHKTEKKNLLLSENLNQHFISWLNKYKLDFKIGL